VKTERLENPSRIKGLVYPCNNAPLRMRSARQTRADA
jgi:hypothetical protein